MRLLPACAFIAGAILGAIFITPHVLGYVEALAGAVPCDSAHIGEWGAECEQANVLVTAIVHVMVPVFSGAILMLVAGRFTGRLF